MPKTVEELAADLEKATSTITQLTNDKKEILTDFKKTQKLYKQFEGVDLEALQAGYTELQELKKKKEEDEGNYKKLYEEQQTQHETALSEKNTAVSTIQAELTKEKKENAVNLGLAGLTLVEGLNESAAKLILEQVAVDDKGVARVGDKPVADYIKTDWAESPVGRHFIQSGNSGGGAGGGAGSASGVAKFFDPKSGSFSRTEQAKIANSTPEVYQEMIKKYS